MEASLERLGEELVRANSGPEALRLIEEQDFAVVLLDVQMPGMDGLETAERIRQIESSRHTPIIFVTAGELTEDLVHRAYAGGAVDFLFKPYAPEIVRSKVQVFVSLFRNSQRLRRSVDELARAEEEVRELNQALEKRVEERTRELAHALADAEASEKRYRQLAESLPQIVWTAEPDGSVSFFNSRFYEYTGISRQSSIVNEWTAIVHPEDQNELGREWQKSLQTGTPFELEFRLLRGSDNTWRYHIARAEALLRADGKIEKWLGIATEIEERLQAQATLKAANQALSEARDRAVEASHAKSLFLANMSHEFRTPLNAILGYAEMLEEELSQSRDELKNDADRIIVAGRHLLSLIDDVLDMAKIEAGKMKLSLEEVSILPVVDSVLGSVRGLANQHKNHLYLTAEKDLGTGILDQVKLRQILLNLLSNACKFTENGEIELLCDRVTRDGREWISIAVRDTGIGIAKKELTRLFKEFSQADPSATRNYGGTGLGLALSQRFAHMMGGTIALESEEGIGSTFTLWLPMDIKWPAEEWEEAGLPQT
jgi:PAS domain S-box-containing protein